MLLDDDVVTYRQAKPRALTGGLGREERIEYLLLHFGRGIPVPFVADPDFDTVTEVLGRGQPTVGFVVACICLDFALGGGVEPV